jgi:putative GTP pyrophosphokinase
MMGAADPDHQEPDVPDLVPPLPHPAEGEPPNPAMLAFARQMQAEFARMQMEHQFAVDEVLTKVSILRTEFLHLHRYNPIEHVGSRVKTPASILDKALRRGLELTPEAIRAGITDIAGVRITCSFIADTYRILETLTSQSDVRVLKIKDYIAQPKGNGYKSLHALVEIPVFLSTGPVPVTVEIQIRTIAMDFWASLEHKIYYKYDGEVPDHLAASLADAAEVAEQLDRRMEQLHAEVRGADTALEPGGSTVTGVDDAVLLRLWQRTRERGAADAV